MRAAIPLVKEGGADMVKLDGAADFPDAVRAIVRAGIPVFAQIGITPQTALRNGVSYSAASKPGAQVSPEMTEKLVEEAKRLEDAGACFDRFHQLRSGGWRGGGRGGFDSGAWEDLAEGRGSMGACVWLMRRSGMRRRMWILRRRTMRMSRGLRSRRSARTSRMCARRGRSRARAG